MYNNYPNSIDLTNTDYREALDKKIDIKDENDSVKRWICFFEPCSHFFKEGVDMDDVLRYKPNSFRMLRAFEKRTFIKIDDEENDALKQFLYLRNKNTKDFYNFSYENHKKFKKLDLEKYKIRMSDFLKFNSDSGKITLEAVLEAFLVNQINTTTFLNHKWDYVSHQVIASPFKPLSYIDKMDIFAYKFLVYLHETKPIEKYLVLELKKDKANDETIEQTMKYVDWVCTEYASGDYSSIMAGVIASGFNLSSYDKFENNIQRTFIKSTHPIETKNWCDLTCYSFRLDNDNIKIEKYNPFNPYTYLIEKLSELEIPFDKKPITVNKNKIRVIAKIKEKKILFLKNETDYLNLKHDDSKKWQLHYIPYTADKHFIDKIISSIDINGK